MDDPAVSQRLEGSFPVATAARTEETQALSLGQRCQQHHARSQKEELYRKQV